MPALGLMDPRWKKFAEVCRAEFRSCSFQAELIAECGGNEDIAWATYFHLRQDALAWLHRRVPSLGGSEPVDLIQRGDGDSVRRCLWSMPC